MSEPVRKIIYHNLILIFVVGITYLWAQGPLKESTLQLISLSTLIYIAVQILSKKFNITNAYKSLTDITLLTFIVFLIIFYTGGTSSQLFFLLYFLLFGISLLFEPLTSLTLAFIAALFFIATSGNIYSELLQLGSLFLITPLAMFFGSQYIELLKSGKKIVLLERREKIMEGEIREQEYEVRAWTKGDFKNHLNSIWTSVNQLASYKNAAQSEKKIISDIKLGLSSLLKSAEEMKDKVEE